MTQIELPEDAQRGLDRRSVVKGAAWSVPVIAAAVATPFAAATTDNWNARIDAGCFIGIAGNLNLIPSFRVTETLGGNATEDQIINEVYSSSFVGFPNLTRAGAQTQGLAIAAVVISQWGAFRTSAIVQGQNSNKITRQPWPVFGVDDLDIEVEGVGSGLGRRYVPTVTLSASRRVTVSGLLAHEQVAWGYLSSVLVGVQIDVPGVGEIGGAPRITATITSGTGAETGDESARLGAGGLGLNCGG